MTTKAQIDDFLAQKRIAVVGVSRDPKEFSYTLWQEFRQRRYDAIPVNPNVLALDNQTCYKRLQDIQPGVDAVLIMTPSKLTEQIVHDAAEAGVKRVWMYGGMAPGASNKAAIAYCEQQGIDVIAGYCPYMFFKGAGAMHAPHRFFRQITGRYPH